MSWIRNTAQSWAALRGWDPPPYDRSNVGYSLIYSVTLTLGGAVPTTACWTWRSCSTGRTWREESSTWSSCPTSSSAIPPSSFRSNQLQPAYAPQTKGWCTFFAWTLAALTYRIPLLWLSQTARTNPPSYLKFLKPMRIRIQIQGFDDKKLEKIYSWQKINILDQKLQFCYP